MAVTQKINLALTAILASVAGLAGCASTPIGQGDPDYLDDFTISGERGAGYFVGGERFDPTQGLDQLNRIQLANIVSNLNLVGQGERGFINHKAAATPYLPVAYKHEEVNQTGNDDSTNRFKHLNRLSFDFDSTNLTSVQNDLPSGWIELDGKLLHQNSGLSCPINWDSNEGGYKLRLSRLHLFDDKGLDVGCTYQANTGGVITLYASYWPTVSQHDHAASIAQDIADRFKTTKTMPVPVVEIGDDNGNVFEEVSAIGFDITPEGSDIKMKSSLWVVKAENGWHVKARATHQQDDQLTEISAVVMFAIAHIQVRSNGQGSLPGEIDV